MIRSIITNVHCYLLLAAVVLAVYGMTFYNAWTYDDMYVVVNNPDTFSFANFLQNNYPGRPLRELTHLLERNLFGVQPAGYHILQLLLHAGNGIMVCMIMMRCGISRLPALIGATLILVHPFQSESVANIGHRKELLALFFGCLSVLSFQHIFTSSAGRRHIHMTIAVLMFVIALAGNETALTFPLVWLGYERLFAREKHGYLFANKVVLALFVCLVLGFGIYKIMPFVFNSNQLTMLYFKNNFFDNSGALLPHIMAVLTVPAIYGYKLFFPYSLAPEYVIPFSRSFFQPVAFTSFAMLLALTGTAIKCRNSRPAVSFGILWILALYLPVSNIVPVGYSMADRYMYLPLAGVGIAVAGAFDAMQEHRRLLSAIAWPLLCAMSIVTVIQNGYWRNEFTLWEHTVKINPLSSAAQESASHAAMLNGNLSGALEHARESVRLNPYRAKSYFTLAMVEEITGDYVAAMGHYQTFILNAGALDGEQVSVAREKIQAFQARIKHH